MVKKLRQPCWNIEPVLLPGKFESVFAGILLTFILDR